MLATKVPWWKTERGSAWYVARYNTPEYRAKHAEYERQRRKSKLSENPERQLKTERERLRDYVKRKPEIMRKCRAREWDRSEASIKKATLRGQRWDIVDDTLVVENKHSTKELSEMLGRSIQGIRKRRQFLRKQAIE